MQYTVALFGETEKGNLNCAYHCRDLAELAHHLGEPPHSECQGLQFAIQSLLYNCPVIFFRVMEEGFSQEDYLFGLQCLKEGKKFPKITALGLPGVGDRAIIEATTPLCASHKSILILTERDLYDYLTGR